MINLYHYFSPFFYQCSSFYYRITTEIAPVLQKIYTRSIQTDIIANDWKKFRIHPIVKKGDKERADSYRPMSLTCICSKILEHIITRCVMSQLETNNILYALQHGFRKNRSCESQLLEFITDLTHPGKH